MADLDRSGNDLVREDHNLWLQHLEVMKNEKLNQLKKMDVHLDQLRTVEMKRIELQKATLAKEITKIEQEIRKLNGIEIKPN